MTSWKPLLSICIPCYKRPAMLVESLKQIFSQINTVHDVQIEIVVVDDGVDQPSEQAIQHFLDTYSNLKYYKNDKNLWFLNTVLMTEKAKGEYLLLLSDDDLLTDFALCYIVEIIKKTSFDILFHVPEFSENVYKKVEKHKNTFHNLAWIREYIDYLDKTYHAYGKLISFFSFYSAIIVNANYWHNSLKQIDRAILASNSFPHELVAYFNLQDANIVLPNNTFVIWRLLNESYPGTDKLIKEFNEVMDYIELQNDLRNTQEWSCIKKICVRWRARTIKLWLLLRKFWINYKQSKFLKFFYFLYKKFVQ